MEDIECLLTLKGYVKSVLSRAYNDEIRIFYISSQCKEYSYHKNLGDEILSNYLIAIDGVGVIERYADVDRWKEGIMNHVLGED